MDAEVCRTVSFTLKIVAADSSKTSVKCDKTTRRYILENSIHHCMKLFIDFLVIASQILRHSFEICHRNFYKNPYAVVVHVHYKISFRIM
jgi:hypothetical protein